MGKVVVLTDEQVEFLNGMLEQESDQMVREGWMKLNADASMTVVTQDAGDAQDCNTVIELLTLLDSEEPAMCSYVENSCRAFNNRAEMEAFWRDAYDVPNGMSEEDLKVDTSGVRMVELFGG